MEAHLNVHKKKLKDVISAQTCVLFFSGSVPPPLCDFASLTMEKKKAGRNGVRKVRQGEQMAASWRHLALCLISGESPSLSESLKSTFSLLNRRQRAGMVDGVKRQEE